MKQKSSGISSVEAKETEDGRLILRFQDQPLKTLLLIAMFLTGL